MNKLTILLVFVTTLAFGQATKTQNGNWNQSSAWASGNIGDQVTENVTVNQNVSSTVLTGDNFVIGNLEYYLVEGFKIGGDEELISYSYFDLAGKMVNKDYTGLKILLIITTKTKHVYKIN